MRAEIYQHPEAGLLTKVQRHLIGFGPDRLLFCQTGWALAS